MATSRYSRVNKLAAGSMIGTSTVQSVIRHAIDTGQLSYTTRVLKEGERLDTMAGSLYGDAKYWWIIAAASGIGWGLQIPPGTVIKVPDLASTLQYVR